MTCLVPNAPVKLNNVDVVKKDTAVSNSEILTIGTCSFRFDYINNPLQMTNGTDSSTPGKVCLFVGWLVVVVVVFFCVCVCVCVFGHLNVSFSILKKSPRTPKQAGKENSTTLSSKATPKTTPKTAKVATTPLAATPTSTKRKSLGPQSKSPLVRSRKSTPASKVSGYANHRQMGNGFQILDAY